jgi:penicillin-binding protein 1A
LYAAALDKGFTPSSIIVDSPVIFDNQGGGNLRWIPENNSEKFYGDTTLRTAVINSRNVPAVKLLQEVGLTYFMNYLKQLGATGEYTPDLSMALGSKTIELQEILRLYSVFPSGGLKTEPIYILRVRDREGVLLEEHKQGEFWSHAATSSSNTSIESKAAPLRSESTNNQSLSNTDTLKNSEVVVDPNVVPTFDDPRRAIDEKTAYIMGHLLQEVVLYGTGGGARVLNRKVGGKTGTTSDFADAWFMGFSPEVVTGSWTGFDTPRTLGKGEVGGRAALPAWNAFMEQALKYYQRDEYSIPKGIVFARINPKTGGLASGSSANAVREAYVEGTEPSSERNNKQTPESNDFFREDF